MRNIFVLFKIYFPQIETSPAVGKYNLAEVDPENFQRGWDPSLYFFRLPRGGFIQISKRQIITILLKFFNQRGDKLATVSEVSQIYTYEWLSRM